MDATPATPLVIMDDEVRATRFACDLARCKGACCTLKGGAGAPVTEDEVTAIASALDTALPYLSERSRAVIRTSGFVDAAGDALRCIDDRDCVFVFYEQGIAKCALERAHFDGRHGFRKPISCHLFPIRRSGGHFDHLRVEHFPECDAGFARGEAENIPLLSFAKDALARAYGEEWVAQNIDTP